MTPGLVPEPASCSAGSGLSLRDQLLQGQSCPFPSEKPTVFSIKQDQLNIFSVKLSTSFLKMSKMRRLHHVEIVARWAMIEQVVALLPRLASALIRVSNLLTTAFQKVGAHLDEEQQARDCKRGSSSSTGPFLRGPSFSLDAQQKKSRLEITMKHTGSRIGDLTGQKALELSEPEGKRDELPRGEPELHTTSSASLLQGRCLCGQQPLLVPRKIQL